MKLYKGNNFVEVMDHLTDRITSFKAEGWSETPCPVEDAPADPHTEQSSGDDGSGTPAKGPGRKPKPTTASN